MVEGGENGGIYGLSRIPDEDYGSRTYPCKKCKAKVPAAPKPEDPIHEIHGYKLYCMDCGTFVGWSGAKKEIVRDGERKFSSQWTPKKMGLDYCQICLRHHTSLGLTERIEIHHIIPVKEGGEDTRENIMCLCTFCHRLVHQQRTYIRDHLTAHAEAYKAIQTVKAEKPDLYNAIVQAYKKSRAANE